MVKRWIWDLRIRKPDCCGQKIAYFLEREYPVRLSVPKRYQILAEHYVIRSKWRTHQKRGAAPKASCARADGAAFLQTAMSRRFTGRVEVLQTDGGPECKGALAKPVRDYGARHRSARPYKKNEPADSERFNRT